MQQQNRPNTSRLVPLSNYDVRELKLENGHQLAMHGLGGLLPKAQSKPTWGRACDTLESVVHQATCNKREPNLIHQGRTPANISAMVASSGRTWTDDTGQEPGAEGSIRKRTRSNSDNHGNNFSSANTSSIHEEHADPTATCASASAGVRLKNNETTNVITWASFESPPSLKTKGTDDDSACQGGLETQDDGQETTKDGGSGCSRSTKPRRAAAIHNQSERKRRDRINQNLKALQRLVPNASKTDKASMLDEVIIYLEQLQAQVQMMNNLRNMSHMNITNMSSAMQQQHLHQMSVLAHMGMGNPGPTGLAGMEMGMGMEMADMSNMARMAAPRQFLPCIHPTPVVAAAAAPFIPPFMMPPHHPQVKIEPGTNNGSDPFSDPFSALIAQQSMHMDLFNRMTALYRQQVETTAATSGPPQSNHRQGN